MPRIYFTGKFIAPCVRLHAVANIECIVGKLFGRRRVNGDLCMGSCGILHDLYAWFRLSVDIRSVCTAVLWSQLFLPLGEDGIICARWNILYKYCCLNRNCPLDFRRRFFRRRFFSTEILIDSDQQDIWKYV